LRLRLSAIVPIYEIWSFFVRLITILACFTFLFGCASASDHRADVKDPVGDELTVGTVQKEIRVGMSGGEVASVLGSPNIVSTDENRREVWIYDKVSTDYAYSQSSGGISALILGWGGSAAGGTGGSYGSGAGASSRTQKTLTVIIKFDEKGLVRDFAYHQSKF
jgi:outer membrane protein assembly factor BamE (lipoprotein component of BamABCDE complex)